jgi:hypothetical protein
MVQEIFKESGKRKDDGDGQTAVARLGNSFIVHFV